MIIFRNVNAFLLGYFGPLFYIISLAIYGILKYKNRRITLSGGIATFKKRVLAFVIAFALIEGLAVAVNLGFGKMENPPVFLGTIIILAFALFNMVILPSKKEWSLGKRALSIKIIKIDNKKLGTYDLIIS